MQMKGVQEHQLPAFLGVCPGERKPSEWAMVCGSKVKWCGNGRALEWRALFHREEGGVGHLGTEKAGVCINEVLRPHNRWDIHSGLLKKVQGTRWSTPHYSGHPRT